MENLWKNFQQVLHSFLLYTEEFRDEYIDLRNRDAEETRSIQDHYNGENTHMNSTNRHVFFLSFSTCHEAATNLSSHDLNFSWFSAFFCDFVEVSKLSEKIADLKSQLINVKDEYGKK